MRNRALLALCALAFLGCAKPSPMSATGEPRAPNADRDGAAEGPLRPDAPGDDEADLAQLERQIDQDMASLGLGPRSEAPAATSDSALPEKTPADRGLGAGVASGAAKAPPKDPSKATAPQPAPKSKTESHEDTCRVIDAICDASERICQITDRLPPEAGGAPRCEKARAACQRAREQDKACGSSS